MSQTYQVELTDEERDALESALRYMTTVYDWVMFRGLTTIAASITASMGLIRGIIDRAAPIGSRGTA